MYVVKKPSMPVAKRLFGFGVIASKEYHEAKRESVFGGDV